MNNDVTSGDYGHCNRCEVRNFTATSGLSGNDIHTLENTSMKFIFLHRLYHSTDVDSHFPKIRGRNVGVVLKNRLKGYQLFSWYFQNTVKASQKVPYIFHLSFVN